MVERARKARRAPHDQFSAVLFTSFAIAVDCLYLSVRMYTTGPARKQVDLPVTGVERANDLGTYNIWDHRHQRGFRPPKEGRGTKIKSQYRCHASLDSGLTRGDASGCEYVCLYFARGICHHGSDCVYLHRVPTLADEVRHATRPQYDIFGRDRIAEEGATKGVGSYARQCTTLYVYLAGAATSPPDALRQALNQDFEEWGPIQDINIIPNKAIAFIRYEWRSSAEFAKAAMHQQQLRGLTGVDHVLDVRWAHDDPNPKAKARVKREQEDQFAEAVMEAVSRLDPESKRARLSQLGLGAAYRQGAVTTAYPNTTDQFQQDLPVSDVPGQDDGGTLEFEDDINRYLPDSSDSSEQETPQLPAVDANLDHQPDNALVLLLDSYASEPEDG